MSADEENSDRVRADEVIDLAATLDEWFDKPLDSVPKKIQIVLKRHLILNQLWDSLTPEQRRYVAEQFDYQNDPATQEDQQRAFDLVGEIEELKCRIRERELVKPITQLAITERDDNLTRLRHEMNEKHQELEALTTGTRAGRKISGDTEDLTGSNQASRTESALWTDVIIALYRKRIGFTIEGQPRRYKGYQDAGLLKRNDDFNSAGALLLEVARGKPLSTVRRASVAEKNQMSKLRSVLRDLTGIDGDPFSPRAQGWNPRFKLVDRRKWEDEDAKKRAIHLPYDDNSNYGDNHSNDYPFDDNTEESDDDRAASEFLKNH